MVSGEAEAQNKQSEPKHLASWTASRNAQGIFCTIPSSGGILDGYVYRTVDDACRGRGRRLCCVFPFFCFCPCLSISIATPVYYRACCLGGSVLLAG